MPHVFGEEPVELQAFEQSVDHRQRADRITAQLLTSGPGGLSRFGLFGDQPPDTFLLGRHERVPSFQAQPVPRAARAANQGPVVQMYRRPSVQASPRRRAILSYGKSPRRKSSPTQLTSRAFFVSHFQKTRTRVDRCCQVASRHDNGASPAEVRALPRQACQSPQTGSGNSRKFRIVCAESTLDSSSSTVSSTGSFGGIGKAPLLTVSQNARTNRCAKVSKCITVSTSLMNHLGSLFGKEPTPRF